MDKPARIPKGAITTGSGDNGISNLENIRPGSPEGVEYDFTASQPGSIVMDLTQGGTAQVERIAIIPRSGGLTTVTGTIIDDDGVPQPITVKAGIPLEFENGSVFTRLLLTPEQLPDTEDQVTFHVAIYACYEGKLKYMQSLLHLSLIHNTL